MTRPWLCAVPMGHLFDIEESLCQLLDLVTYKVTVEPGRRKRGYTIATEAFETHQDLG